MTWAAFPRGQNWHLIQGIVPAPKVVRPYNISPLTSHQLCSFLNMIISYTDLDRRIVYFQKQIENPFLICM